MPFYFKINNNNNIFQINTKIIQPDSLKLVQQYLNLKTSTSIALTLF